jgi:single-strand DNA-binding protein
MARGLNKVMFIGTVEQGPEVRFTAGGKPFACFGVSIPRIWTTTDGEQHSETECFSIVAWGVLADPCARLLSKGCRVYVGGRLQTHSWSDSSGQKHHRSEIVANQVFRLSDSADAVSQQAVAESATGSDQVETEVGLNSVMLIGHLGQDPDMHYTPNGNALTSFLVATSRSWSTAEGGRREETEWFNVVAWGNLAEICNRYLVRGSRVYIDGRLQAREWEDDNRLPRQRIEVVADEMIRLDARGNLDSKQ